MIDKERLAQKCSTWNILGGFFVFLGVRTSTKGAAVL